MSHTLAQIWYSLQSTLFPALSECLPEPVTEKQKQLVTILEIVRIEEHVESPYKQGMGRPECDRRSLARAFVVKAVYNLPQTDLLIEMLKLQPNLRQLCGWERFSQVPSASTFSRSFAEFASDGLGDRVHAALVKQHVGDQPVIHISRDSTEVVAREQAAKKDKSVTDKSVTDKSVTDKSVTDKSTVVAKVPKKRGRPKKGEVRPPPEPKRLDIQLEQSAEEALAQLPKTCDWGTKMDTGGHKHTWKGWKAHIDWADGSLPISVVTTSASVHDSQVAIPLARMTAERVTSLYDLMDSAYDAPQIRQVSQELDHVALIDPNPRRGGVPEEKQFDPAMKRRYQERSTAERGNSRLKDSFGLRHLRVRGHDKAHLHIMFGVLCVFADQLMKPFRC